MKKKITIDSLGQAELVRKFDGLWVKTCQMTEYLPHTRFDLLSLSFFLHANAFHKGN